MARVVGYTRVSTNEQQQSLEAQAAAIRAWCKNEGHNLISIFVDRLSGGTPYKNCPGLRSAVDALPTGGVLAVSKHDRLSRDVEKAALVRYWAGERNATVYSCDGEGNDATLESKIISLVTSLVAEIERERASQRIKAVQALKREKGEHIGGKPPLGRRRADGQWVTHEDEVRAAARAKELRADGLTYRQIAEALHGEGLKSRSAEGRPYGPSAIQKLLRSTPA